MDTEGRSNLRKRIKPTMDDNEGDVTDEAPLEIVAKEETEANLMVSEEMELHIGQIHDKIERFTQQVSEVLESAKSMLLNELSNDFEERMIMTHKEHIEKWQFEIKEARALDALNEEANNVLQNARLWLPNPDMEC